MAYSYYPHSSSSQGLRTLILAGGQSSRMGQDKALLSLNGVPLLRHLVNQVWPISTQVHILTSWPERYRAIASECQFILEKTPGSNPPQGPLVACAQGLTHLWHHAQPVENSPGAGSTSDWVLLLACDLPYLTTAVLQDWLAQLPQSNDRKLNEIFPIAALPQSNQGWEPLCGFYHRSCLPSLRACVDSGGRSFQRWLQGEVVQVLTVGDALRAVSDHRSVLFNCNTPADWEMLQTRADSLM